jgi:ribonuclease E
VERALRDALKRDRARTKILRTSPFGLIEMTRQRVRPSLKKSVFQDCPACHGTGVVKTPESMGIEVVRTLLLASQRQEVTHVAVTVAEEAAEFLNNRKRKELTRLEDVGHMVVQIIGAKGVSPEHLVVQCRDSDGREVKL